MSDDTILTPESAAVAEPAAAAPQPVAAPAPAVAAQPKQQVKSPWLIAAAAALAVLILGGTFAGGVAVGTHAARGGRGEVPPMEQWHDGQGQPPGMPGDRGPRGPRQLPPNGQPVPQQPGPQAPQPDGDSSSS